MLGYCFCHLYCMDMCLMKLCIASDLHLEIGGFPSSMGDLFSEPADVLILAGDITCAKYLDKKRTDKESRSGRKNFDALIKTFSNFRHVLYVAGNHEHYGSIFSSTVPALKLYLEGTNAIVLDNDLITIDNKTFIGSTLWTDYRNGNPLEMLAAESGMNDYRQIQAMDITKVPYTDRKSASFARQQGRITPSFILTEHHNSLTFIQLTLAATRNKRAVVITHHAPSYRSQDFANRGSALAASFCSALDDVVATDNIDLWIHGHTHDDVDYMIDKTRVLANHRGYAGYEKVAKTFKPLYVEI